MLAEKAFACAIHEDNGLHLTAANLDLSSDLRKTSRLKKMSHEMLLTATITRTSKNTLDNARIAHLCGGSQESVVPDMALLNAGDVPVPSDIPKCSATQIRDILLKNAFAWCEGREQHALAATMKGGNLMTRETSCLYTGSALYVIASMMNHAASTKRTTIRSFCGPFVFVLAARDLEAGEELTTHYFVDKDSETKSSSWEF